MSPADHDEQLKAAALRTASSILLVQRRIEQDLIDTKRELQGRTAELARSLALLRATIDASPDGIIAFDRSGTVVTANARLAEVWQLDLGDPTGAVGTRLIEAMAARTVDPPEFTARMHETIADPERSRFDTWDLCDGGRVERLAAPQWVAGRCEGSVQIWRDVTERKKWDALRASLEEQVRHSQKMESLGVLAGGIAHDFNNILGIIIGNLSLIRTGTGVAAEEETSLQAIELATERAKRLVQQIQAFSRRDQKDLASVPLQAVVGETLDLLRATTPAGVRLVTRIDPAAPAIRADPTQLHQVLMNLCTNALQAVQDRAPGDDPGWIEIGLDRRVVPPVGSPDVPAGLTPGLYSRLTVRDNGVGMTATTRVRIFDPFFTTRAVGHGTGLGLSVVHGIVASFGGMILVESRPGEGSAFHLYFPADRDLIAHADPPEPPAPASDVKARPAHVVYVDDEPALLALVGRILRNRGFEISTFAGPADALPRLRSDEPVDLLITDFNMPGASGIELVRAARARRPDLPVILVSGYITAAIEAAAAEAGVQVLMLKPDLAIGLPERILGLLAREASSGDPGSSSPA